MKFLQKAAGGALCIAAAWSTSTAAQAEVTSVPYGGVIASHSGKCLAPEAVIGNARLIQRACDGSPASQFRLEPTGDGSHTLVSRASQACLVVSDDATSAGAQIVQGSCATAAQWTLTPARAGYQLKATHSGMCLQVDAGANTDGAPLIQSHCSGADSQVFRFERPLVGERTPAAIMSSHNGQCINASETQATCDGSAGQQWRLKAIAPNVVEMTSVANGMCLDGRNSLRAVEAPLQTFECHGGPTQQWRLRATGNAWRLESMHSGMCLHVEDGRPDAGARLFQGSCEGTAPSGFWTLRVPTPSAQWLGSSAG